MSLGSDNSVLLTFPEGIAEDLFYFYFFYFSGYLTPIDYRRRHRLGSCARRNCPGTSLFFLIYSFVKCNHFTAGMRGKLIRSVFANL